MLQKTKMTFLRLFAIIGFVVLFAIASISLASCSSKSKTVSSMVINDSGELVVTYSDGSTDNLGAIASSSSSAKGISSVDYKDGSLVITYTDNSTETVDISSLVESTECDHLDANGDDAYIYVCDVKSPTDCTKGDGLAMYYCPLCDNAIIRSIPVTDHTYVKTVTAATCTDKGYTSYTCSVCGDTYVDENSYVDALGHTWNSGTVVTEATCTTAGSMTYTCTVCGGTKTEAIAALGHAYDYTKDPVYVVVNGSNICENGGYYVYECANGCNVLDPVYVAPQDHQIDFTASTTVVTAPTTTTAGSIYGYCANCGEWVTVKLPVLNSTDYTYTRGNVVDCSEDRTDTYVYTYNGYSGDLLTFTNVIAGGYHYVTVTYTDTNGATQTAEIAIDDTLTYVFSDYVPGTNNCVTYGDILTLTGNAGDCGYDATTLEENTGNAWFNCDVCETKVIVVTAVIPHTYDDTKWEVVTAATCTTAGVETNVCTECGWTETRVIPATGHDYTGYALKTDTLDSTTGLYIAGTNYLTDSNGYYTAINYCVNCYAVKEEITVKDITTVVTLAATCTTTGLQDITITLPDSSTTTIKDVVIPALGHYYNGIYIPDDATIHLTADGKTAYYTDTNGKVVVVYGTYDKTTVELASGLTGFEWTGNTNSGCATGSTGTVYYTCDACGKINTLAGVTDHTLISVDGTTLTADTTVYLDGAATPVVAGTTLTDVAATCNSEGITYEYCTVCGEYIATTIAATDHTYAYALTTTTGYLEEVNGVWTYTAGTGDYDIDSSKNYTVWEYCTVCGTYTPYTGTLTTTTTSTATCLTEGIQTNTITYTVGGVTQTLTYTETVGKTGHPLNGVEIDDTLTYYIGTASDGTHYAYYLDSSSVMHYVYQNVTDAQIESGEKKIMYITGNSTTACDGTAGEGYYVCDNAAHGSRYVIVVKVMADHTLQTTNTVAATATTEGIITYTCKECGYVTYDYIKPLGYTYTVKTTSIDASGNLVVVLTDENGDEVTVTFSAYESTSSTGTGTAVLPTGYAAAAGTMTGYTVTTTTGSCTEDATTAYSYSYVYTITGATSGDTYTYTYSNTYVITSSSSVGHVYETDKTTGKEVVYTFSATAADGYLHNYEVYKCTVCGQFIVVSDEIDATYAAQAATVTVNELKTVSLNSAATYYEGTLTIETEGYYAVDFTSTDAYITMTDSTGAYSWSNVSKLTNAKTVTASTDVSTYIVDAYGNPALIPAGTVFTVTVALYDQDTTEVVSVSFTVTSETYDDGTIAVTLGKTIDALDVASVYSFTAPEDGTYYVASENDYLYGVYIYDNLDDATEGNYNYLFFAYQGSPYTIKLSEGQKIYIIPYDYAEGQDLTITMKEKLVITYTEYSGTAYNVSDSTAKVNEYGSATVAAGDTINSVLVADKDNYDNLYIATEDSEYFELAIGSDTVVYEGVDLTYGLLITATTSSKYYGLTLTVAESCDVTFYIGLNSSSSVFTITGSDGTVVKTISDEDAAGSYTVLSYTVTLSAGTYTLTSTGSTTRLFAVAMDIESSSSSSGSTTTKTTYTVTYAANSAYTDGGTEDRWTVSYGTTGADADSTVTVENSTTSAVKTKEKSTSDSSVTLTYYYEIKGASSTEAYKGLAITVGADAEDVTLTIYVSHTSSSATRTVLIATTTTATSASDSSVVGSVTIADGSDDTASYKVLTAVTVTLTAGNTYYIYTDSSSNTCHLYEAILTYTVAD